MEQVLLLLPSHGWGFERGCGACPRAHTWKQRARLKPRQSGCRVHACDQDAAALATVSHSMRLISVAFPPVPFANICRGLLYTCPFSSCLLKCCLIFYFFKHMKHNYLKVSETLLCPISCACSLLLLLGCGPGSWSCPMPGSFRFLVFSLV